MSESPMQRNILRYLKAHPGWHTRQTMIKAGVGNNNYSRALGAMKHPRRGTLLGNKMIECRRDSNNPIEYRIRNHGQ